MRETVDSTETSVNQSGGGSSVYIPADWAEQYNISPGDDVTVELVREEGGLSLKIPNIGDGFTREEFVDHAESGEWEFVSSSDIEGIWSYTYTLDDVSITVDAQTHIGDDVINNVFVKAPSDIEVESMDHYEELLERRAGMKEDVVEPLHFDLNDTRGLFQQAIADLGDDCLNEYSFPDREIMETLLQRSEKVFLEVSWVGSSLFVELDELDERVRAVQNVYDALES